MTQTGATVRTTSVAFTAKYGEILIMRWRIIDLFSLVVNVFTICNMSEFISELFGEKLVGKEGDKTAQEALSNKQFIGVYFSAHW